MNRKGTQKFFKENKFPIAYQYLFVVFFISKKCFAFANNYKVFLLDEKKKSQIKNEICLKSI